MNSPVIPRHPLDHENVTKIALGHAVTAALEGTGRYHLLVSAPSDITTPEHLQGRRILHCLPCSKEHLDAAYQVASGTHKAVKIKPSIK